MATTTGTRGRLRAGTRSHAMVGPTASLSTNLTKWDVGSSHSRGFPMLLDLLSYNLSLVDKKPVFVKLPNDFLRKVRRFNLFVHS